MAKTLHCTVITPEQQVFDADASEVVLPAHDGLLGVLKGRAPLVCELGTGVLRVDTLDSGSKQIYVDGGFGQILHDEVTILTERAAAAENISKSEASKKLDAAHAMRITDEASFEARQRAIAGAEAQQKIAQKP